MVEMSEASNKALNRKMGGEGSSKRWYREYGGSLRRVRCQANGLAYASTLGWMRVEPQQRDAHPTEEQSGSMNLPTSVEERIKRSRHTNEAVYRCMLCGRITSINRLREEQRRLV